MMYALLTMPLAMPLEKMAKEKTEALTDAASTMKKTHAASAYIPSCSNGQVDDNFNNNIIGVGCGSQTGVIEAAGSNLCTIKQPFYHGSDGWMKLTYWNYALNTAVTVGGAELQFAAGCGADYSGISGGVGTITSTQVSADGSLSISRAWTISSSSPALSTSVLVTNTGATAVNDISLYYGTKDDWVGTSDRPTKTPAMVTSNGVDTTAHAGNAVVVSSSGEMIVLYSPNEGARGLIARCCSFQNILSIPNPSTFESGDVQSDGSYAMYVPVGNLAPGQSKTLTVIYGVGQPSEVSSIAAAAVSTGEAVAAGLTGEAVAAGPLSVHGDPMFQHDGKGQHFWLKEDVLNNLLDWKSDDGHEMSLQGLTVANTETGHQWFKQIALMSDGKKILSSEVVFDDKPTLALSSLDTSIVTIDSFVKGNGVDAKNVTGVSAGGMTFELTAESAHKFDDTAQQSKYAHVNVKMPNGLAKDATGLFAELAGAQPMSDATKALLASPK